ncbi:Methyltransferase type 11 [Beutenbergia cavernae DSM 12333]|uniref:Methyltransferase type 11 n=1 Tax=Beutenbergia cavernae (strain ATCC BAA-8 / DSM 12333 / CCUG 43141 / JCM 11478 / NBRC 16432 / NCIMB 13614 / HKI 0122) TaxID=471853 RepID=C5C3Z5_BEUC1|nr:class I SAM-dependent methyltransferase [Beutenbergia cavernae]ACQ79908.1 Methyltransferase type 11 [Beutenbergia cavernae DSM 12333]
MDGADPDRWSLVAQDWSRLWGDLAAPAWDALLRASEAGAGARVLDVGCGSGDLLAHLEARGLRVAGVDPAPGMLAQARARLPGADLRPGDAESLTWGDGAFDLVTAVNALQFADDVDAALAELVRVTAPGGHVAVASWAEDSRNDLATIEAAVAAADGEESLPEGELRGAGGLEALLADAGLTLVEAGLVDTPWDAADDETLVRAVLLGEDDATIATTAPVVLAAAAPFRRTDGSYRLACAFRYAVARRPAPTRAAPAAPRA